MTSTIVWHTILDPHDAPTHPGVYEYWSGNKLLYIGKAISIRARLLSHAQNAKLDAKERSIVKGASKIRFTLTDNEFLALLLEAKLINKYKPPYNFASRDDKSYLYIVISLKDKFPKPQLIRGKDLLRGNRDKIFGPFPSTKVADEILRSIRKLIPFCQQKGIGKRACFYSHVGLCNPCPSVASNNLHLTTQYRRQIMQIVKILEGKTKPVINTMTNLMNLLSADEKYEEALLIRNKIERFQRWIDTHSFSDKRIVNFDNTDRNLEELMKILVPYLPTLKSLDRIECYDASNLLTQFATVSMVVSTGGRIDKSSYKRFKIKNIRANSDFSRLKEALTRRFNNNWPSPNLLVIDGGKPQVKIVQQVLDQLPNPPQLIGLAKAPDRLIVPSKNTNRSTFITVHPQPNNPGFNLLKSLRDESHRFANNYRLILEKREKKL